MVKNLSASLKGSASAFQDKKKELLVHKTNVATGFGGGKSSSAPFQNSLVLHMTPLCISSYTCSIKWR